MKTWKLEYRDKARDQLRKLDSTAARRILTYMRDRVATSPDPRQLGKPLKGQQSEYWRYRVGDYRIICDIQDDVVTVLVLRIGHRKDIYE